MDLADLASNAVDDSLPLGPAHWEEHGVLVLPEFIPEPVIDAYCDRFQRDALSRTRRDGGGLSVATGDDCGDQEHEPDESHDGIDASVRARSGR